MTDLRPDLRPCPFCGGTDTDVRPEKFWMGMRSVVSSVTIIHWCLRSDGQPESIIKIVGRTEAEAIDKWNRRI